MTLKVDAGFLKTDITTKLLYYYALLHRKSHIKSDQLTLIVYIYNDQIIYTSYKSLSNSTIYIFNTNTKTTHKKS